MKRVRLSSFTFVTLLSILCCQVRTDQARIQAELKSINLLRGDIALCGSEAARFGKVEFALSCQEDVRANFNLATALLHSFEYSEAEKVFARVIDSDPACVMAYWGVAMSNFHPLWAPPSRDELEKGSKTLALARSLEAGSEKESDYLEAAGVLYDGWEELDHKTRLLKFEDAAEKIFLKYPEDKEALIFFALALRAASDPGDKTFTKQKKAGELLSSIFPREQDHPGIAHYLIHTYDYPELADKALPAARKYAAIAGASAHALHMPSHIFTRMGLWDESIQSNINSMAAAKCYAENSGMQAHWDEEIHALDYLVYAYLQQGRDQAARDQMNYLRSMENISRTSFKNAYTLAAVPTRVALETRNWKEAAELQWIPTDFPWDNFPWEKSIVSFGRALGAVRSNQIKLAKSELEELKKNRARLEEKGKAYEANQVDIQIKASEAWIAFYEGDRKAAERLMTESADMEEATEKHPVTPGEVVPARELLGDLYMEMGEFSKALAAYESELSRHPGRLNSLHGAGLAAAEAGQKEKSAKYFQQLDELTAPSDGERAATRRMKTVSERKV